METLLKADIFFFISTIESVLITILLVILLYYLIQAGRGLYKISEYLKENYKDSEEFIQELKGRLEGNFLFRLIFPPPKKLTKQNKK